VPVVHLRMVSDRVSVIVHVWDISDDMPVRQSADPDIESGRGLLIVESLAKEWGAQRQPDGNGKVVWARIGP
jgi:hypothetical protein